MITLEKLSGDKLNLVSNLLKDKNNNRDYKLNFIDIYKKKGKLLQYFYRKNLYLIKYGTTYVGYIWIDTPTNNVIKILDFYILRECIPFIDKDFLKAFGGKRVVFECLESDETKEFFSRIGFNKEFSSKLLKLKIDEVIVKNRITKAKFRMYKEIDDAGVRCCIQNAVFNSEDREPLTLEDILHEEGQDYFIKELCVFIKVEDVEVGYGQIIFNRGVYTIVNFGLIEEFRNKGYGADLLLVIIELSKLRGVSELYIRVDENNAQAIDLYKNVGFNEVGDYCRWGIEKS